MIISKAGKPIVKLVRFSPDKKQKRKIGLYQGKMNISKKVLLIVENSENQIYLSLASVWEMIISTQIE
ncbi:hypothetical protein LEP1GSC199_1104 [Leptospira vanthielii serovar Holland str. Waz Holland = ATCC 700522]|uniref:Uncharacterized protein n=1 Tax=Leptospira vanthielii serovar Holland str. Waz Holland = ATCC 700522 TaxID=1218591 RepID=N1WBK9_9LEPT|nr:hypothetical protein LEP1GSC199_1104 [Leptospira vanthielii serovar Holland str. Waz Holland = ATCC 700522]